MATVIDDASFEGDLERFVTAQVPIYAEALTELRLGRKRSHWMWFVFPQMRGLGRSEAAEHFGIGSLAEARAYLAHPLLGARLQECTHAVLAHRGKSLREIFGSPDDLKFLSSMTLFAAASLTETNVFTEALGQFCGGVRDAKTLALIDVTRN